MPKVSVIIPVYNVEKYLRQCLDSVVNQTLKDIEIICVDDGSTDNSLKILKEYAFKDDRFIIIEQKNQGAGAARNKGLEVAKGEFVHFMDSDDWIETYAYEELYNLIIMKKADLIKFRAHSYNNKTGVVTSRPFCDVAWVNKKYFENYLNINEDYEDMVKLPDSPWSGFYKRDFLVHNHIYFDNFVCANDVGFFFRCIINAKKVYLSSNKYVYYRENLENSLVARRAENFDCQTALYKIIKKVSVKLSPDIRNALINHSISSVFGWYKRILNEYSLSWNTKNFIHKEMEKFIKEIHEEKLNKQNYEEYKIWRKNKLLNIFSVQNEGIHKVVTILGLKLKFKSKRLVERERLNNFEGRINYLTKELNRLSKLVEGNV